MADTLKRAEAKVSGRWASPDGSSGSGSASELSDTEQLEFAEGHVRPQPPNGGNDVGLSCPEELAPLGDSQGGDAEEMVGKAGDGVAALEGAPVEPGQHRKLTLAQLHRIRTTRLLNSTLTASEV